MPKKKLTDHLRAKIKKDYDKLKESDYSGDALTYLRRVRGAARSRRIRYETELKIDEFKVPKNSELYRKVEAAATMKGQTVRQFMSKKKNKDAVLLLFKDGGITMYRESEYLIEDIRKMPKGKKVFWNQNEVDRLYAISLIMEVQSLSMQLANVVMIRYEIRWDLIGNLYISDIYEREDIDGVIEEMDEIAHTDEERAEYWLMNFMDEFESLEYVAS